MPSSTLFLNTTVPPSFIPTPRKNPNTKIQPHPTRTKPRRASASSSSSSWVTDFDLYGLLGVESSSDPSEIKKAYRALQKRCHPDVAGPAGHDMAIILNDVYSLLSDPNSRSAYDQEQAKLSEFRGYTGKPLYSTWCGSESEQRAVFVDEVKCVGCLKCALHASKTFAIESAYGRARAIAQWADPEDRILDAIQTCPVDCISIVERSNLAALEFLMSKQPRGKAAGARASNMFAEVDKFQRRFAETNEPKESNHHQESRIAAVQAIRSISNWWYWRSPSRASEGDTTNMSITHVPRKSTLHPDTERLREAAARIKSRENAKPAGCSHDEDYWTPTLTLPPAPNGSGPPPPSSKPSSTVLLEDLEMGMESDAVANGEWSPMSLSVPLAMAATAAVSIGSRGGEMAGGGLNDHVGGSTALEVVNSFEMQVVLAGFTWFVIGMGIVGVFEAIVSKGFSRRQ